MTAVSFQVMAAALLAQLCGGYSEPGAEGWQLEGSGSCRAGSVGTSAAYRKEAEGIIELQTQRSPLSVIGHRTGKPEPERYLKHLY